jgi:hypothetical protein
MSACIEQRDQRRRAAEDRRLALAAAVSTIRKNIADLPAVIADLEVAGGCARLVAALRAVPIVNVPEVGGVSHPDAAVWDEATAKMVGGGT